MPARTPYLRILTRGRDERRHLLDREVICIGRSTENELAIPDLSLSREHACVSQHDGGWFVSDRESRNGTFLNDRPIKGESPLHDGDIIRLGETTLVFHEEGTSGVRIAEQTHALGSGSVAIPAAALLSSTFRGAAPQDARLLDAFARASRMLIARAEADEVFAEVLRAAMEAVQAERGALMLLDSDGALVPAATQIMEGGDPNLVLSRTITRMAIDQKTSILTMDAQVDERFDSAQSVSLQGVRSALCAPLWLDDVVKGLIYLDRRYSARPFTETDLALLTVIANLVAAKIENLRLLEESQLKRKLEEELALAADIQRSLLPRQDPVVEGWSFAGMSLSSRAVGGDLYDYIAKPDGRLGFVVADVSGKGVSAALLMASLQANLRAFVRSQSSLSAMMTEVNRAVLVAQLRNRFATVLYAEVDLGTGKGSYVNAGHNPGLLLRRDGQIEKLTVGGMIVGAFPAARYEEASFAMEPGDLLVLYSDGVTEAPGPDDELFGDERLEACVRDFGELEPAGVRDGILDRVDTFTKGRPANDDTTILVAKRARQD